MSLVHWVGKPDYWTPPEVSPETARWALAATEEALPEVCAPEHWGKLRITRDAALKAVDRYLMRLPLPSRLNPEWAPFEYSRRIVVKAPASSGSSGVHMLNLETPENAIVSALRAMIGNSDVLKGVVEEFVDGDAIEISGVRLSGKTFFFHPLRQYWTEDLIRIERYERVFDHWWLYQETSDALNCIRLDNSAFCVEWRVTGYQQAKLIEINPRPGDDDKGYFEALWDRPIADQIEEWATDVYHTELQAAQQAQAQATRG